VPRYEILDYSRRGRREQHSSGGDARLTSQVRFTTPRAEAVGLWRLFFSPGSAATVRGYWVAARNNSTTLFVFQPADKPKSGAIWWNYFMPRLVINEGE
jgi:hypothetical protein